MNNQSILEAYFSKFRENTIGNDLYFHLPYGTKKILYADWIASGRLYRPIEEMIINEIGPFTANTHSESSLTGSSITHAYFEARKIIKKHVNANENDILIAAGSGMTGMINKFQRILGLRVAEQLKDFTHLPEEMRPVVLITHMEHHSNQTSWLETICTVVVVEPGEDGLVNLENFEKELKKYKDRKLIISSVTACSNVTGIFTPYYEIAKLTHAYGGYCFVDFACSAPYTNIDMHPKDKNAKLDAIFFSPHKFLGGPGSTGILIFDSHLYKNKVPDNPGGGTVEWTNPWGQHKFTDNIEVREDGGTPPFLQTIKAALAIKLKEQMGVEKILEREHHLVNLFMHELRGIPNIKILASNITERLGAISFYIKNLHYNLLVKMLNDRYGIQTRGGCSCAGTYGHYLLHVDPDTSKRITEKIDHGDLSEKPGWVRISLHPTMTEEEIYYMADALRDIVKNKDEWEKDYTYSSVKNEFINLHENEEQYEFVKKWFHISENSTIENL